MSIRSHWSSRVPTTVSATTVCTYALSKSSKWRRITDELRHDPARLLRAGTYGRRNAGWRRYCQAFDVGPSGSVGPLFQGLRIWLRLEAERAFHLLRHGRRRDASAVVEAEPATPA